MKTYERRNFRTQAGGKELKADATESPRCNTCGATIKGRVHRCNRPSAGAVRTVPAKPSPARTGKATRPDGSTVTVTIPGREESEPDQLARLGAEVIAAANVGWEAPHWELADLEIALRLQAPPGRTYWVATLGRTQAAADSAADAVTGLREIVKRSTARNPFGQGEAL